MNLEEMLKEKSTAQNALLNSAIGEKRAMTEDEQTKFDVFETEIKNLEKTIVAQAKIDAREAENKTVVTPILHAEAAKNENIKVFKNFADQLRAVKNASTTGRVDERLTRLNNEYKNATGMNEGISSEGGFAIQTDFAGMMMDSAAKEGEILSRVDKYQVSGGANSVKWVDIDETSVATTVFGGVQVYWAAEAGTVTASKPKLMEKELKLEKLMGLAYATYELENDSSFVSDLYTRAFTLAIRRELEASIVSGTGVGKPLGFLTGASVVSVAKETGQVAATVMWENISKMYNRAIDKTKGIWLMHPDVQEQLDFLTVPVGVGGVPVYLQETAAGQLATLKGKPIVESDHCAALGTVGDINFVDLSQYLMVYKGGVQADSSIHVQFLAAENCFRFIFRANGMPKRNSTLTIKNSANARSSFVNVATR
jgi:HK97 family phage major capsid protein